MNALDAFALIAYLTDEPAAAEVEELLREPCIVSSVNLAEALDVLGRVRGIPYQELRGLVDPLLADAISVETTTAAAAWQASSFRARHYDRSARPLSLADCFLLATASTHGASIATADPAVAAVARDESLELVPLPDSAGRRP